MPGEPAAAETEQASPRARLAIALVAGVALAAIIVVVAIASGGDDDQAVAAAPTRCVEAWNSDEAARGYGRHNFNFHLYTGALVTFLSSDGLEVGGESGGLCAVIFPSEALDPEPVAAGQVLRKRIWVPISELEGIELTRVAELQALAAEAPNTTLDTGGSLTPL
jgi:hypothetical protein